MSFRVKACAATIAAACVLFTPAAMASPGISHAPVQVTGKQLKNGLLPPSHILPGYVTIFSDNSGGKLEHGGLFHIPTLKCSDFWAFLGTGDSLGETAQAETTSAAKSAAAPVHEFIDQSVYQFASTSAAATFFNQVSAKFKSCRSVSVKSNGSTLKHQVHSRTALRVGGHQSLKLVEFFTDSKAPGPPLVTDVLLTVFGDDFYMISTDLLNVSSPKPSQSSLMLKLIPRIRALK